MCVFNFMKGRWNVRRAEVEMRTERDISWCFTLHNTFDCSSKVWKHFKDIFLFFTCSSHLHFLGCICMNQQQGIINQEKQIYILFNILFTGVRFCTFSNLEKRLKIHHPSRFVLIVKCILHLCPATWAGTVVADVVGLCPLKLSLIYQS